MPVIVHQAKRQQLRRGPFDRLKQDPFKRRKIVVIFKNRQPRIRAIPHVINRTAFRCSLRSAYRKRLQNQPHRVKKRFLTRMALSRREIISKLFQVHSFRSWPLSSLLGFCISL